MTKRFGDLLKLLFKRHFRDIIYAILEHSGSRQRRLIYGSYCVTGLIPEEPRNEQFYDRSLGKWFISFCWTP